jgi:hypothetical protein
MKKVCMLLIFFILFVTGCQLDRAEAIEATGKLEEINALEKKSNNGVKVEEMKAVKNSQPKVRNIQRERKVLVHTREKNEFSIYRCEA